MSGAAAGADPLESIASTVVAAFDFDATLTRSDSVVPFMARVAGRTRLVIGLLRHPVALAGAALRRDRDRLRELATAAVFSDRPIAEIAELAESYAADLGRGRLRDDTVARLGWHREQGHEVVIVSASYEVYLRPVASQLGAAHVLGTRLDVDGGRCTGRLDGQNCRAAEKVRRLEEWLAAAGRRRDEVEVWAYGDSRGDREMLAWADRAVWVREPLTSVSPSS